MRFIPIEKAKGLKPGMEVFTQNKAGEFGFAKIHEISQNVSGIIFEFEVPQYFGKPATGPVYVTDIVAVRIPKKKEEAADE